MRKGYDFDQAVSQGAVEVGVRTGAGDADVLTGEVDRLVVLDLQVVIVDPVDGEGELGRRRGIIISVRRQLTP